jgi:hypothetical protein
MISITPKRERTGPAPSGPEYPPAPIMWREGLQARTTRFGIIGAAAGLALLGIGALRIAFAVVLGWVLHQHGVALPPSSVTIRFGLYYVGSFGLTGAAVGFLWPLRVRRWGRILVDLVGAGVLVALLLSGADEIGAPLTGMTPGEGFACWLVGTLVFGGAMMLQNNDDAPGE